MKHSLVMNSAKLIPFISGFIGLRKSNAVTVNLELPGFTPRCLQAENVFYEKVKKPTEGTKWDLMEFAVSHAIPGIQCSIAIDDGVPNTLCHGFSDVESRYEVDACTKFRQGEISMLHVAYFTYKLIRILQTVPLELNTKILIGEPPLDHHHMGNPQAPDGIDMRHKCQVIRDVTVEEILKHRGGFRDLTEAEQTFLGSHVSPRAPRVVNSNFFKYCVDRFDVAKFDRLTSSAQEPSLYSRHGYHILALYLGRVLRHSDIGILFDKHFQKEGLADTATDKTLSITMQRARHYQLPGGNHAVVLQPVSYQDPFIYAGAHGFLSTSKDLALFGQKLLLNSRGINAPNDPRDGKDGLRVEIARIMFDKWSESGARIPSLLNIDSDPVSQPSGPQPSTSSQTATDTSDNSYFNDECLFGYINDKDSKFKVQKTNTPPNKHGQKPPEKPRAETKVRKALAISNTMGASNVLLVKGVLKGGEQELVDEETRYPITVAIMTNVGGVGKEKLVKLAEKIADRYQNALAS